MIKIVLLHAKTTVPAITLQAIERQRLLSLFHQQSHRKVTLLRAPAGYGKTTLLTQWIEHTQELTAWLSLDETDNDPVRFWKYMIGSVCRIVSGEVHTTLQYLLTELPPIELLVDCLLNELETIEENIHIVIDDYHVIENTDIHSMMTRFINYLPPTTFIYVTSRTDLSLPLAKWRTKGWLTEIGTDQLCFTYDETERFYNKSSFLNDHPEYIQLFLDKTEGWAAGIQLIGLAEQMSPAKESLNNSFETVTHFVTDFLLHEILPSLSLALQDFLLRTSILNHLDKFSCAAVTSQSNSDELLLELENKGFFIVRSAVNSPVFHYHQLFKHALQTVLIQRYSEEEISLLYKNAADFLYNQGDFYSAIELALQGGLYSTADDWIVSHLIEIFTAKQTATFIRWMQILRHNDVSVNVETLIMYSIVLATRYEMAEASQVVMELDKRHTFDQWMEKKEYQGLVSIFDMITAFILLTGGTDINKSMKIISTQMSNGHVSSKWDWIPMEYNWLEPTLLRTSIGSRGRLLWPEDVLPLLAMFENTDVQQKNMSGFACGVSAETSYYRNQLDQSLTELEIALQYGHSFNDPGLVIPMYIVKAKIYAARKQFDEAIVVLDTAIETTAERYWLDSLRTMKAQCLLQAGDLLRAQQELHASTGLNNPDAESEQPFWALVNARMLLAQGQGTDALKACIRIKEIALRERQVLTIIEAAIVEAVCHKMLGNKESAMASLQSALKESAPYGYIRTYLDEPAVLPLVKKYAKSTPVSHSLHAIPTAYVQQLVDEAQKEQTEKSVTDVLTPREKSVFELLCRGASNSEIASELSLSEGSVRVYLSTIYSKLGVNSRTKAILLAKED